ncbi:MAG: AAA family ATPase [Minicystis sp.]
MKKANGDVKRSRSTALTKLVVGGYKSFADVTEIEIRPLTILAGANSSGKSSAVQPLLLMKQTLEASYDPGGLKLDGPHVKLTDADQMFWRNGPTESTANIVFGLELDGGLRVEQSFRRADNDNEEGGVSPASLTVSLHGSHPFTLSEGMSSEEIGAAIGHEHEDPVLWDLKRSRGFLTVTDNGMPIYDSPVWVITNGDDLLAAISSVIHLPGLRGNPERSYPVTAIGPVFPGPFEAYTASVLLHFQRRKEYGKLAKLVEHAESLGLAAKIEARQLQTSTVEVLVSRVARPAPGGVDDLVNIADVGFGVSQTLPVLVALQAALPGQLVYIEQPEIHLHPRAQVAMAAVLAEAAMRGVRVVVETHSDRLLLGIQTLVAEGTLPPELVKLHWFTQRGTDGATEVRSGDLDAGGAFGDWPEDFAEVELTAESRYLDASEARLAGMKSAQAKR